MTEGFTTIANDIIDSGKLDPYQGWILLRIARRGICFESQRSIAEGTNISLAQVNRTIKWLHENGYIEQKKDERYGRLGWSVVIPEEQTQQNVVIPQERNVIREEQSVIPGEHVVIPQERHLNKTNIKRLNNKIKEKEREAPVNAFWSIPENLQEKEFLKAWKMWLKHVDEARLTFTETQAALILGKLSDAGLPLAIKSVENSLSRGWKNLHVFDPSMNGNKNGRPQPAPASERVGGAY